MAPVGAADDPTDEVPDVAIVGAGVQGMGTARRLAGEGMKVVVLDRQQELGGVWSSFANSSSRVQVNETYYRLGYTPAEEDYTQRANVIAEMRKAAASVGVLERLRCGVEVVRVEDVEGEDSVRLWTRPAGDNGPLGAPPNTARSTGSGAPLEQLRARQVIFCTGGLQRPRRLTFAGEQAFGGPVFYGLGSRAEALGMEGKRVTIVGMGAFGIENARTAMLAGAAHVDVIAKRRNVIITRFATVMLTTGSNDIRREIDRQQQEKLQKQSGETKQTGPDIGKMAGQSVAQLAAMLFTLPFTACGAEEAMPKGGIESTSTVPTVSDVFFIGYALGRIKVHVDTVDRLEPGAVVLTGGERLGADVVIKNPGFEDPEADDLMGSTCEVVGHRTYQPPMWITPRVMTFRSEHPRMGSEDEEHRAEMYNLPASIPFYNSMWLEVYLHFRERPEELQRLLDGPAIQHVPLGKATLLDAARGLHAAIEASDGLGKRINAQRRKLNTDAHKRYAPPHTPAPLRPMLWYRGFLNQNRKDWQETCRQLTGDPNAVPFVWEGAAKMFGSGSRRPTSQAAL